MGKRVFVASKLAALAHMLSMTNHSRLWCSALPSERFQAHRARAMNFPVTQTRVAGEAGVLVATYSDGLRELYPPYSLPKVCG